MTVAIPSRHSGDSFPSEPSWMHVCFRSHSGQNRTRISLTVYLKMATSLKGPSTNIYRPPSFASSI